MSMGFYCPGWAASCNPSSPLQCSWLQRWPCSEQVFPLNPRDIIAWDGDITALRRGDTVSLPHSLHFPSGADHFPTITTSSITSNDKQALASPVNPLPRHPHCSAHSFSTTVSEPFNPLIFMFVTESLLARLPSSPLPGLPTRSLKSSDCPSPTGRL